MTQNQRVLKYLRTAGQLGTTLNDWDRGSGERAIDGGPRITRLAARIRDLKDQGHRITKAGDRDGFDVYVLDARSNDATVEDLGDGWFRQWICDRCQAHTVAPIGPVCPMGHDAHLAVVLGGYLPSTHEQRRAA